MKRKVSILIAVTLGLLLVSVPAWAVVYSDNSGCFSDSAVCHGPLHQEKIDWLLESSHVNAAGDIAFACETCHEGAANHKGEMRTKTTVHFDLEVCGSADCHPDQYGTYTYGDDWKTKYGGSPGPDAVNPLLNGDPELWDKLNDFAYYNDIIDGYGFTKEYNEERSHNVMIQDHYDVSRGKKDTCLQCKSTKLAYYWDTGQEREILNAVTVHAGHMTEPITVPKGTKVIMATARDVPYPNTHETQVLVTLPNGTTYASYDVPGAINDGKWLWAALYALTVNELPPDAPTRLSGNGCNHCHDPHKAGKDTSGNTIGFRLIRKSLMHAIENKGINPYRHDPENPIGFDGDTALTMDEGIALCAQCHVEYVCGNSPIDGIDRDFFPWAKVFELEDVYAAAFPGYGVSGDNWFGRKYVQDWIHGTGSLSSPNSTSVTFVDPNPIQEELIKSQHPEAETYWESRHYDNDAPCFLCHMPRVTKLVPDADGNPITFTSHWLASPNKYMDPEPAGEFATTFGLEMDRSGIISPCGACHGGKLSRMKDKAIRIQDGIYDDALVVQAALVDSLRAIKKAKDDIAAGQPVDAGLLEAAAEAHRAAHVKWENLVVSENSMGFHNPSEVSGELSDALALAQSARQNAEDALGGGSCTDGDGDGYCDPEDCDDGDPAVNPGATEICDDGIDNDCNDLADGADPICLVPNCNWPDKTSCNADPACRWNKNKGCINR
jgi:formate-dependent nitrite reductase cytochrome c552 subunit